MGLFDRLRPAAVRAGRQVRDERREEAVAARRHLEEFARTRAGVEAYLEPATTVLPPTVVLIASTGEWTRRRIPSEAALRELAASLAMPVYDVKLVGYPQRMRDWSAGKG